ncbi:MAG: hypothetical protein AAF891_05230 [Pseudomonadota bacterium]
MFRFSMTCFIIGAAALSGCNTRHDKAMHFVAGAAVSKHVGAQAYHPAAGCAAAIAAGIAKEAIDAAGFGMVDRKDALATAAGCSYTIRF